MSEQVEMGLTNGHRAGTRPGYKHASLAQRAVIVRLLDEHWDFETKWYRVGSGFDNDEAVAKAVGCGKASVRNMRQAMYPNPRVLRQKVSAAEEGKLDARVIRLEAQVSDMKFQVAAMDGQCARLISAFEHRIKILEIALT